MGPGTLEYLRDTSLRAKGTVADIYGGVSCVLSCMALISVATVQLYIFGDNHPDIINMDRYGPMWAHVDPWAQWAHWAYLAHGPNGPMGPMGPKGPS